MDKKKPDPDEAEPMEATVLPAREAMSLISPSRGGPSSVPIEEEPTSEGRTEIDDSASAQT